MNGKSLVVDGRVAKGFVTFEREEDGAHAPDPRGGRGSVGQTYSSWLNQVERFFSLIADKAIRRGSFTSVEQLVQRIDHFVAAYNTNCRPSSGLPLLIRSSKNSHRLCSRISGTEH